MRWLALLVAFVVTACMPVAPRIYAPANGTAEAVGGRACEPNFKSRLLSQEGVVVNLVLRPRGDALVGTVQVDVPAGKSFRFLSSKLTIRGTGADLISVALSPGRYSADEQIYGFALAEFSFAMPLPSAPEQIAVNLPPIELDRALVQPKPAVYALRRQPMVIGLCQ
jgi:hypothetical protein